MGSILQDGAQKAVPDCNGDGPPALTTVTQEARRLGISPWTLRSWVQRANDERGSIPYVSLPVRGRRQHIRFQPAEVDEWLAAGSPPRGDWKRWRAAGR